MIAKLNPHKGNLLPFLLIIFLISASDLFYFIINAPHSDAIFRLLTCFSVFLMPLYIFRNHLKLYTQLLLPIFLLIPFSIAAIIFFNLPINSTLVLSITNTTTNEAFELIHHYLFLFSVIVIVTIGLYFLLLKRVPSKISSDVSFKVSVWSLLLFAILPWFDKNPETLHRGYIIRVKANLYATFPFSVGYCSALVYTQYHLIKTSEKERNDFKFNAKQASFASPSGKQIYLLIIGESSRADHWSINGYNRITSPHIARRENFISFSNTAAGASFTEFAVPQIITCATTDNFEEHFKEKSIISIFKEAGFDTYWITDQEDEAHIRIHELEADHIYLERQKPSGDVQIQNTDMQLVNVMNKVLEEPGNKKFIVVHTWGSHFDYGERYTNDYDVFQPSLKSVFARPSDFSKKNVLVNSYDNSILFSDAVIDSAISLIKNTTAISAVYYISDHGENLFDDANHYSLHEEVVPTIYTLHIPFFIWYSDSLKNISPSKIDWLVKHKNNKIGVEDVIHTITDMSNISFSLKDSSKCIDQEFFADSKQKALSENYKVYSYDSLNKNK
jgi:glucan phosphoethanolaminetransferase (alkaline phosphatase superfamily)